ncbi:iron ABC transporter substrate-binding protein [Candidatus Bathyarchaeota archaeon A05DMB-2]|jgi:iron complex transport system substrate-binding protein|nr:iron ABC transporter substrate-binding protein [Candidatus Bathyarchaeota archaeon A05DMB-2]
MNKNTLSIIAIVVVAIILVSAFVVLLWAPSGTPGQQSGTQQIIDMTGRNVTVPNNVQKVIAVNPGALRLITYMDASDLVCGVEEVESDPNGRPYAMAHPEYATLPVIGPQFGGDPELIAAQAPDVVFTTDTVVSNLDALQNQLGIPVVGIVYGGLDTPELRQTFYDGLTLIGKVLHKESRATEVINYVKGLIDDLEERTFDIPDADKLSVYVGGLSSRGNHGFTSTAAYYAPFTLTNSKNVIIPAMAQNSTSVVNIDVEVLPGLNPQVIFVDYNGLSLCREDVQKHAAVYGSLDAITNNCTYGVMGYNWYHLNFDVVLTDAYYVGKVLYPNQFADIDIAQKANEIYEFLVGTPLYEQMVQLYGPFDVVSLR